MYAFQTLLQKLHAALRPNGVLILRIPEPEDGALQAWRAGELLFAAQTGEPIFNSYTKIGKEILFNSVVDGRFQNLGEQSFEFDYHYDSVQAWWHDVEPGCEDRPQLEELGRQLRALDNELVPLRVSARYQEWTILLQKK